MVARSRATLKASSGAWGVKGGIRGATSQFKPPCPPLRELILVLLESSAKGKKVESACAELWITKESAAAPCFAVGLESAPCLWYLCIVKSLISCAKARISCAFPTGSSCSYQAF
ncbi:hypothetical protein F4V45_05245 [Helicobacter canis]|uniref:Uncharacterized protein n=1 Tax=Helicobacter canis TaxID=29419 RepID=A0A5M9QPQ4_9HELI|nr:hypothetical protein F4V45_05245 [Helicobacter canis]